MKKIKLGLLSLFSVFALAGAVQVFQGSTAYAAACANPKACIQQGSNDVGGKGATDLGARIKTIVNILLYVLGAIAVVMIVIGGIRYTTSNGDSSAMTSAKNTILYAVVGLVIAILSYSIVNFVLDAFN
ncbi:MAG TPA: pilin [Candidatus Saccharimonadales bacterium]|nr:pilin [Candidatus Saccharimonadales bacterium]